MSWTSTSRSLAGAVPSRTRLGGYALLCLVATGLGLLVVVGTPLLGANGRGGVIVGVTLVSLAAAPTVRRLRVDLLDAPGLYALFSMLYLGLTSLAWLGTPYGPGPGLSAGDIAWALLIVALAVALFGVGARLTGPPQRTPAFALDRARAPSREALLVAYAVALVGVLVSSGLHIYGYLADPAALTTFAPALQALSFLGTLGGLVVLVTALVYFGTGDRTLRTPLITFVVIQTAFGVFSGVKGTTVEAVAFVLLAYVASGRHVPWKSIVIVAAVALLILVPVNAAYRQALRSGGATASGALNQAVNSPGTASTTSPTNPITYLFTRFRLIDNVALIVSQTSTLYPFADGSTYYKLPAIVLVPRAIWPSKPVLSEGLDFSRSYWQITESNIRTSTPLTQVGDLYRNFGLAGVILGMVLVGLLVGGWQRLRHRWSSPVFTLVFIFSLLAYVIYVESDLPELLATASKTLPLVVCLAWLLLPRRRGQVGYRKLLGSTPRSRAGVAISGEVSPARDARRVAGSMHRSVHD